MSMVLFGIVAFSGMLSYAIIRQLYPNTMNDNMNTPYPDMAQRILSKIQNWVETTYDDSTTTTTTTAARTIREPTNQNCLEKCFAVLMTNNHTNSTSPTIVQDILDQMNLRQIPMVNYYMRDYLSRPVSWQSIAERSLNCLGTSITVSNIACTLRNALNVSDAWNAELEYAVNVAVVIEELTKASLTDLETLIQISNILLEESAPNDTTEYLAYTIKNMSTAIAENKQVPTKTALRIHILETVLEGIKYALNVNARIGLDLAVGILFNAATVSDHQLEMNIGRPWVDAYIGWNAEFIITRDLSLSNLGTLLIPSVTCSLESDAAGSFLFSRIISLGLSLQIPGIRTAVFDQGSDVREAFARESLDSVVPIARATRHQVQSMLAEVCSDKQCRIDRTRKVSDTLFISNLSDEEFNVFYGFNRSFCGLRNGTVVFDALSSSLGMDV